jgi:hypothetical protein
LESGGAAGRVTCIWLWAFSGPGTGATGQALSPRNAKAAATPVAVIAAGEKNSDKLSIFMGKFQDIGY